MKPKLLQEHRAYLKKTIENEGFVRSSEALIVTPRGRQHEGGWLFDIRNIALNPEVLEDIAAIFWETFRKRDIQIGGIETAAIPLITALVYAGHRNFDPTVSGFFIRKSRKKAGLMKIVEGQIVQNRPIVLVDDLINSGNSLRRQIEILKSLGHTVTDIWTILRFRDVGFYDYLAKENIRLTSVFELNDFPSLGIKNLTAREKRPVPSNYRIVWKFASERPSYHYVVPKSDPVIDEKRLYVGSDIGVMRALDQETGQVVWEHEIGFHAKGKGIFSSPALYNGVVYFGGYDGNLYALDAEMGALKWVSFEADWIGSSPCVAPDLESVFVGLEFGLWRKRGGIAALDLKTGKTIWRYAEMPCLTHSSPHYIQKHQQVAIGSNDGCVYLFDARAGTLLWKKETGPITEKELSAGFSAHDIKESIAYDEKRDLLIVANMSGSVQFLNRLDGMLLREFKAEYGFFSTPVIFRDTVLVSSLDKHLYCLDIATGTKRWAWYAGARIFATPIVLGESIFIGANTGRLTELDANTGKELSLLQLTERITNKIAYNAGTGRYFVSTFANELYCAERLKSDPSREDRESKHRT